MKPSRQEDLRLVTGRGRFTADWNLPGQLHAHVVRSDRAHARIVSVDWDAVRASPGVVAVLTADDLRAAGFADIPSGAAPLTGRDGQPQRRAPMPVLAGERVRFVGQPIALVVAGTARQARDAAEQATIDYDDLPAVVGIEAAVRPGAAQLHEAAPGNLSIDFDNGDAARVDAAFAAAAHVTTLRVASQRLVGSPMEPRACLAFHDDARGKTVVWTPTQGMLGMRASLSAVTGWPAEDIEVVAQDVGGSFGLRGGTGPEQAVLMLAARRLGRPVKWVASRSELFVGEWHGRALTLEGSVALDAQGRILAIRFDDWVDLGAYSCYWGSFIGTRNISVTMGGVYRVPALYMRSRLVYTNTVPVSAYRGAGRPDIAYAIERLIEQAAAEHGFDPVALRRINYVPKDAFPYTTANGTVYDCGDFEGALERALALSDYAGFPARREEARRRGRLRGIGLASYLEASGGGGAPKDQVACEFDAEGGITLYGVTGPSGQGHETSFAQIVGEGLGLPAERIRYRASDPGHALVGNGTGGSRSLYGAGSAFKNLVSRIVERGRPHAAEALGVDVAALQYRDGAYRVAGGVASIALPELARRLAGPQPHPLDCDADSVSGVTYPNGCHVAEVEIDPDTGSTRVVAYTAVDDLGHVVSPQLVQGQVHGGVVQGIGQAFGEQAIYDGDSGQLLTGSFTDYAMPRAGCLEDVRTDEHPVPTALNALGAKGVGESGCSGSLPALANAMMSALRPLGVAPMDMPFTPARVWQALRAARGGDPT
jgi:carbon-monoxide dehydrogenase large subunit